ncbi:DUF294 nucleotidyltransferase-like domain-containing protein [Brevibacillus humidisoli]|uniref:DUF294 nucleotidyltransferase-like domain-containing protein n=1 Tax=Brevibacillus humidisoli TaxID=2895522 RepID=UPI001E4479A4|nr:DUF294 nucleotidyltransferase-like domain-containing protein [Brevibacillus humidisoli]UFJ41200.1 DUF294 nucleotidyltransferase-like domain-containing protein [Brevibacillus humidisoli]
MYQALSPDWISVIQSAANFSELSVLRRELLGRRDIVVPDSPQPTAALNMLHQLIVQQAIEISIRLCNHSGMGNPPVPYVFLAYGSGGRMEQSQTSDQDNGLVYQIPDGASEQEQREVELFFSQLADTLVGGLAEVGYPECSGGVICSNPRWRRSLEIWKSRYDDWAEDPVWEHIRYLLLCGDARPLSGDFRLYSQLQAHYQHVLTSRPQLFNRMLHNTLYYRVPLNWFGRLRTEVRGRYQGALNLKYGVYLPYVNSVRLWALAAGIGATSTLERIRGLREAGDWSHAFCDEIESNFRKILLLRLLPIDQWPDDDYESNSYLKLEGLPTGLNEIKSIIKASQRLQKLTWHRFAHSPGMPGQKGWFR